VGTPLYRAGSAPALSFPKVSRRDIDDDDVDGRLRGFEFQSQLFLKSPVKSSRRCGPRCQPEVRRPARRTCVFVGVQVRMKSKRPARPSLNRHRASSTTACHRPGKNRPIRRVSDRKKHAQAPERRAQGSPLGSLSFLRELVSRLQHGKRNYKPRRARALSLCGKASFCKRVTRRKLAEQSKRHCLSFGLAGCPSGCALMSNLSFCRSQVGSRRRFCFSDAVRRQRHPCRSTV